MTRIPAGKRRDPVEVDLRRYKAGLSKPQTVAERKADMARMADAEYDLACRVNEALKKRRRKGKAR